jgi:glycosyltransferase involved in cell wall biosynthesis
VSRPRATVYIGVDTDRLRFSPRGGDYLAWIGRISPVKGLDRAIRIAHRAGLPLKVAARMPLANHDGPGVRADWGYYRAVIEPLLREPGVEYVGEVDDRDKADFLGGALALFNSIDWPEPFGRRARSSGAAAATEPESAPPTAYPVR